MRNLNIIIFWGTWEYLNNPNFKSTEFDVFKTGSGNNAFILTSKKWIESINSEMILKDMPQSERLIYLNEIARRQVSVLIKNKSINKLENLKNIDNNGKLLIENKVRIGDDKR